MLLYLKIKPNQRSNRITKEGGEWLVRISAPAVDGKANEKLVEYLSEVLDLARSKIQLRKGHTGRLKCLEIDGFEEDVFRRLDEASRGLHK
jgi:uncharacterized protein (TIGR00251 family)